MNAFFDMLSGTPTWVWVLLVFLVIRGVQASRPGLVQPWRLAILPVIFTALGLYGVAMVLPAGVLPWLIWLACVAIAVPLGQAMGRGVKVLADHQHCVMQLPGSWSTLVLILCIFVLKYALGYQAAVNPMVVNELWFTVFDAGVSGVVAGLFIGRFMAIMKSYRQAPSQNLLPASAD
jgi:hypothetical protein